MCVYRHTLNRADDIVICYAGETDQDCFPGDREIAEAGWFAPDELPEHATERTRWMIDYYLKGQNVSGLATAGRYAMPQGS